MNDDGEAGAVNLYGPAYHLPVAISGMNSNRLRGYGDPAPEVVITVGFGGEFVYRNFQTCQLPSRQAYVYATQDNRRACVHRNLCLQSPASAVARGLVTLRVLRVRNCSTSRTGPDDGNASPARQTRAIGERRAHPRRKHPAYVLRINRIDWSSN